MYKSVFRPLHLGTCEIKNRIFIPALTTNMGERNLPSQQLLDYYEARAAGGVGAIFMEGVRPSRSALARPPQLAGFLPDCEHSYRGCAEVVHKYGAKLFVQIVHIGRQGDGNCSRMPAWGASPVPWAGTGAVPHEMTHAEIRSVIDDQIAVAKMIRAAGIDGIELHLGHGHLAQQFLSPVSNHRTDMYGGSEENRMRFALELFRAIREEMGHEYPVGFRYSLHEYIDGGLTPEVTIPILLKVVDRVQMDFVHLTQSAYHGSLSVATLAPDMSFPDDHFRHLTIEATAALRAHGSDIPVLTVARFREMWQAEDMIANGHADMVGMGRATLADPEIVNKSREGREDEIVPCIACNQGCLGRNWTALPITCTSNPTVGREAEWGLPSLQRAKVRKSILVIGGGPAGLEAAHVAAARGHHVTLWEKSSELGGQLRTGSRFAKRESLGLLVDSLIRRCEKAGVTIEMEREANLISVRDSGKDEIVFATGSRVRPINLPAAPSIIAAQHVAEGSARIGDRVAVYDLTGGYTMVAVMDHLMAAGKKVTLVTPAGSLGWSVVPYSLYGLMHRFRENGVRVHALRRIVSFDENILRLADAFCGAEEVAGEFDDLVVVDHNIARDEHRNWFLNAPIAQHSIGDCLAPRTAVEAVFEGHELARLV
jgi:2,4-dienoyl-CoA reductase-like NADH-dependent reductase (Old Yellow Enzyme family)